mmetsp:Transcript_23016/g.35511  ORF Transcript_23016/g.35511 Transcript_23016/m.35511 type:complete len:278 (+) Transcript_23016:127-960(+)|eukprot:CAMPEP_0196814104 /NCGR_PEP_ID=MMETSP1362-20130617/41261_1 /TAXON_ID=163516 /ORGANISM="Leptocylindrus danicus, Strain CCMP1856" /LENGTH=277 /DNA_ID=CAMNT_0042190609 /DNA_START=45 /DNA_END=878 /DNA_ORIENTATION=-
MARPHELFVLIPLACAACIIAASYWCVSSSNHSNLQMAYTDDTTAFTSIRGAVASYGLKDRDADLLLSNNAVPENSAKNTNNQEEVYVFLQKFPLQHSFGRIFHTEIVACSRAQFTSADQQFLDGQIAQGNDFAEVEASWWERRSDINCVELGYGGSDCTEKCCSVVENTKYKLSSHVAMITNVESDKKSLFLYGIGAFDGNDAYRAVCDTSAAKCWSRWTGTDYNLFQNNCNTFTSAVLSCVYGLSQKKPGLGVSDLVTVSCQCDVPEEGAVRSSA